MEIWFVAALLLIIVLGSLLLQGARVRTASGPQAVDFDRTVFRDQMNELQRDADRGLISQLDVEAARNEIGRRLLDANPLAVAPTTSPRLVHLALAAMIPVIAIPAYLAVGSPATGDLPRQLRLENAVANKDYEAMVAKVEAQVQQKPDDLQAWKILASAYLQMQRYDDAADATREVMGIAGPSAELLADYGEMLTLAANGIVPANAVIAFEAALKTDPKSPKARFLSTLALKQQGKLDQARLQYNAMLAEAPADAPWRQAVIDELKSLDEVKVPMPSAEQVDAVKKLNGEDQQAMIRTMVDGLAEKLVANPNDLAGWQRLIRARTVLGEQDKALAARQTARDQFKNDPAALDAINTLSKELNLP